MKLITRDNLIDIGSLKAEPMMDIVKLLKPLEILRLNVDEFFKDGFERLRPALTEPSLKLHNSARSWTIYYPGKYAIGQESDDQVLVTPWSLDDEDAFNELIQSLENDKILLSVRDDGYVVMARKKDIPSLKLEEDLEGLWFQLCAAYLEHVVLTLVNWSFTSRRSNKLDPLIKDVALRFKGTEQFAEECGIDEECFTASSYVMDTIPEVINPVVKELTEFVEKDRWAYYSVVYDRRGISINRHHDARALIWNKAMMDVIEEEELENEALSAWAVR